MYYDYYSNLQHQKYKLIDFLLPKSNPCNRKTDVDVMKSFNSEYSSQTVLDAMVAVTKAIVICILLLNHEVAGFEYSQKRTYVFCYFYFKLVHRHIPISLPNHTLVQYRSLDTWIYLGRLYPSKFYLPTVPTHINLRRFTKI